LNSHRGKEVCVVLSNQPCLALCSYLASSFLENFLLFWIRFTWTRFIGRRFNATPRAGTQQALKSKLLFHPGDQGRPFSWKTVSSFSPVQQTGLTRPNADALELC
jgi:hypothetical protein